MCYEVVGDFLPAPKFFPDWFVASKRIKKLQNGLMIYFFRKDSGNVTFCWW